MPSHQARRKPLPKDYQFPTPNERPSYVWPMGRSDIATATGTVVCVVPQDVLRLVREHERVRAAIDDGEGYGHAV